MSTIPGTLHNDPFSKIAPPRTPGTLGIRDAGDPNTLSFPGDTPGSVGVNDGAAHLAVGMPGMAGTALRMLGNVLYAATPTKASAHHRRDPVYSLAPEAAAKKKIDDELGGVNKDSSQYWLTYIRKINSNPGNASGAATQVEAPDKGFQAYYVRAGFEGCLQAIYRRKNASAVDYDHGFERSRLNDALVVFDSSGSELIGAVQLVYSLKFSSTRIEFQEWSDSKLPIFVYYNGFFKYPGFSVMGLHKITYVAHSWSKDHPGQRLPSDMAPPVKGKGGIWVDIHDASHGTLGCIGVETSSVPAFNAIYGKLRKYERELGPDAEKAYFTYEDEQGGKQRRPFPGHHLPIGRLTVVPAPA